MAEKNDSGIKIVGTIEGEAPESMKAAKSEDVRPAPASCRVGFERFLRPSARSVQLLKILDNLPAFSLFLSLPSLPSAPPSSRLLRAQSSAARAVCVNAVLPFGFCSQ
eukprot:COSAG06_NODE_3515_length_5238_cov_29.717984_9_plen_108_part_00